MVIIQTMEFFGHETKEIEKTIYLDYWKDRDGRHWYWTNNTFIQR